VDAAGVHRRVRSGVATVRAREALVGASVEVDALVASASDAGER